ncbi:hypothetical protein U728_1102 [Clostridium botulinum 202F]|nr:MULTISPECIES: hypothetical protein [Clostridium]AIY78724.1 hypothetical protein U728_1697 [Clostridium botulinum 202F]AIY79879.1 hypothetical protein U728_1102 [Clostridium botulinum 202F]
MTELDRCRHCDKWMKQSCPKELKGLKPSMNQLACNSFLKIVKN